MNELLDFSHASFWPALPWAVAFIFATACGVLLRLLNRRRADLCRLGEALAGSGSPVPRDKEAPVRAATTHAGTLILAVRSLQEQLLATTSRLGIARARLEGVGSASRDAVVIVDRDGCVVDWSEGAAQLFGLAAAEALRRPLAALFVPLGPRGLDCAEAARRGVRSGYEGVVLDARGRCRDLDVRLVPLGGSGEVCLLLADRAEVLKKEEALRTARQSLAGAMLALEAERQQASQLLVSTLNGARQIAELRERASRADLLNIRVPLSMLTALYGLMARYGASLPQEARDRVHERIREALLRLSGCVDHADGLAPANSPLFHPELCELDISDALGTAVESARRAAPGREFLVAVDPPGSKLVTDARLFGQILEHVLSNAHKFSPLAHPVRVAVACEDGLVCVTVSDAGSGLSEAEIERLFEPFYRAGSAKGVPGSGLGLTIVKNAVDLLGGVVMVESVPGQGTIVTVNLPDLVKVGHGV